MTRYRALSFGKLLAPRQTTYELAAQTAIAAESAHREPGSGHVYLPAGIEIEDDAGDVPLTLDLDRWVEALEVVRRYRTRALAIADDRITDLAADAAGASAVADDSVADRSDNGGRSEGRAAVAMSGAFTQPYGARASGSCCPVAVAGQ